MWNPICKLLIIFFYCSIMEYGKSDMNYESETSRVIPDLNKETSVAYLQKELEILRTSNKKV